MALLFTTAIFATPTDDLLDAALKGDLVKAEVKGRKFFNKKDCKF
jgi:hypothetical protein